MEYVVMIEKTRTGYSAYVPDLPGCVATGRTLDEVRTRMREAISFHIEGLKREGLPVPHPSSKAWIFEMEPEYGIVAERSAETLYDIKTPPPSGSCQAFLRRGRRLPIADHWIFHGLFN